MDGDMNDIFQKLNSILADKETSDNLKNILNNFSSSDNNLSNFPNNSTDSNNTTSNDNNWANFHNTASYNNASANNETSESNQKSNFDYTQNQNSTSGSSNESRAKGSSNDGNSSGMPEFDLNTILKLKSVMDSFKNQKDDPRANLLLSLKPYLADSKKEKIDQYVKFLNLAKVIEVMNPMGGDNRKNE